MSIWVPAISVLSEQVDRGAVVVAGDQRLVRVVQTRGRARGRRSSASAARRWPPSPRRSRRPRRCPAAGSGWPGRCRPARRVRPRRCRWRRGVGGRRAAGAVGGRGRGCRAVAAVSARPTVVAAGVGGAGVAVPGGAGGAAAAFCGRASRPGGGGRSGATVAGSRCAVGRRTWPGPSRRGVADRRDGGQRAGPADRAGCLSRTSRRRWRSCRGT